MARTTALTRRSARSVPTFVKHPKAITIAFTIVSSLPTTDNGKTYELASADRDELIKILGPRLDARKSVDSKSWKRANASSKRKRSRNPKHSDKPIDRSSKRAAAK